MADYNTFIAIQKQKPVMVSGSIRKCIPFLKIGSRIEVWNHNQLVKKIYVKNKNELKEYIEIEKEYHRRKQERLIERKTR